MSNQVVSKEGYLYRGSRGITKYAVEIQLQIPAYSGGTPGTLKIPFFEQIYAQDNLFQFVSEEMQLHTEGWYSVSITMFFKDASNPQQNDTEPAFTLWLIRQGAFTFELCKQHSREISPGVSTGAGTKSCTMSFSGFFKSGDRIYVTCDNYAGNILHIEPTSSYIVISKAF